ncbi:MAG: TonB-dependent receptor [Pseudomonadota bacterium]|nr:TonB-dependent receptor [Pseudomonadota bacterium]
MHQRVSYTVLAALIAGTSFLPAIAQAQSAPTATGGVGDIVVTAQRRSEAANNVSTSIRAFTGKDLQQLGVNNPLDLGKQVTGLLAKNSPNGASQVEFYLRGVGLTDFTSTTNPSVGIYVDDVSKPAPEMANFGLFDMARVEVLKGPQGTLYGRNSTAGAVNFISQQPVDHFEGYVRLGYSSFDSKHYEAVVNAPLTSTLYGRISFAGDQAPNHGYFTNLLNGDHLGRRNENAVRAQLLWKPDSRFEARLTFNYGRAKDDTAQLAHVGTKSAADPSKYCAPVLAGQRDEGVCVDNAGYASPTNQPYVGATDFPNNLRLRDRNGNLRLNYDFGRVVATSITAYQKFNREQNQDIDASPLVQANNPNRDQINAFSQEVRLTSDKSWGFDWIVGAFYSYDRVQFAQRIDLTDSIGFPTSNFADQRTRSEAVFATVTVPILPKLDVIGGVRYTHEARSWVGGSFVGNFDSIDQAYAAGAPVLSALPLPPGDPRIGGPDDFANRVRANKVNFKAQIEYRPVDNWLLYAGVSNGFRSGGFSSAIIFSQDALQPYKPETLTDYEIGAKLKMLGGRLQLNGGAFYYDYKGYQANFVSEGEANSRLQNVGTVHIYGVETDITARPIDPLLLRFGAGYLHTEIVKSDVVLLPYGDGPGTTIEGNSLSNAPKLSLNGLARYDVHWSERLKSAFQLDFNYVSSHYLEPNNRAVLKQDGYALLNMRITLADADDKWEIAFWGKNLTRKVYKTAGYDLASSFGFDLLTYGQPRTFGGELTYRF